MPTMIQKIISFKPQVKRAWTKLNAIAKVLWQKSANLVTMGKFNFAVIQTVLSIEKTLGQLVSRIGWSERPFTTEHFAIWPINTSEEGGWSVGVPKSGDVGKWKWIIFNSDTCQKKEGYTEDVFRGRELKSSGRINQTFSISLNMWIKCYNGIKNEFQMIKWLKWLTFDIHD